MKKITIFLFITNVLLFPVYTIADTPKQVAIFVNGYFDCCAWQMADVKKALKNLNIEVYDSPWNSLSIISGADSQNQAGKVTVGATKNFVDQMRTYFASLPEGSEVYLFGHSFGGDSILQFLEYYGTTRIKIRLVALLDPVKFEKITPVAVFGLRPSGYIRSNVEYFFNRWQRVDVPPTDYKNSGKIECHAGNCDQEEQSRARESNGDTIYIPCQWHEVTCPGYVPFKSPGRKQRRLGHQGLPSDNFIEASLIKIVNDLASTSSLNQSPPPTPPPPHSIVKLCNSRVTDEIFFASSEFDHSPDRWTNKGWFSLSPQECITKDLGLTREQIYYYAFTANGLEWPVESSSNDAIFCARAGRFAMLDSARSTCEKYGDFMVRGAMVDVKPGVIETVDISPQRLKHTLTVKNIRTNLGFGIVTSLPAGIDCGGSCSADYNGGLIAGTVILTATANGGSNFSGWRGCTPLAKSNQCQVVMTEDKVVEAHFTDRPVMVIDKQGTGNGVVTSSTGGIDCGLTCIEEYAEGDNFVTLEAKPDDSSIFSGWHGFQANPCSDSSSCDVNVDSFHYLIAQFDKEPTDFTLDITKNGMGSGAVISDSFGIDCGDDCSENYAARTRVELIALPDINSVFLGWNGECSGKGNCVVDMYSDKDIRATFATAHPLQLIVKNLDDKGSGSLRQAILDANDNPGDDVINFSSTLTGAIVLNEQIPITDSLTINGLGADKLAISGNNATRIFEVDPGAAGTVAIHDLTLKEGSDQTGNGGGAMIINSGTVAIDQIALIDNSAVYGGGAIFNGSGEFIMGNSIVAGNTAQLDANIHGTFTSLGHNLIGENAPPLNTNLTVRSGHKLVGKNGVAGVSADSTLASNDLILEGSLNTVIGSLANNGGAMQTHLPLEGSVVIDAGDNDLIPHGIISDQRGGGFPRVSNGVTDIGAVEVSNPGAEEENKTFHSLNVSVQGQGIITSTPSGIECGATCSAEFPANTLITLKAESLNDAKFTGWSGACHGVDVCEILMSSSQAVTVNFEEADNELTSKAKAIFDCADEVYPSLFFGVKSERKAIYSFVIMNRAGR